MTRAKKRLVGLGTIGTRTGSRKNPMWCVQACADKNKREWGGGEETQERKREGRGGRSFRDASRADLYQPEPVMHTLRGKEASTMTAETNFFSLSARHLRPESQIKI